MKLKDFLICSGLVAGLGAGLTPVTIIAAPPTKETAQAVSEEASQALLRMGQTLRAADGFSFQANTIRVYPDRGGEPLHIFHTMTVTVRRPDKLRVEVTGDDGAHELIGDGKTLTIYSAPDKKYASLSLTEETTIDGMLKEAVGRYGVDFPLADFLSEAPNKAFLTGVTSGRVVNTVTIDGVPYDHLMFSQPPKIVLELWLPKGEQVLPRRLIVTYGALPGQPDFIAEFSDWNLSVHPADSEFVFQPPADAVKVAFKPLPPASKSAEGKRK